VWFVATGMFDLHDSRCHYEPSLRRREGRSKLGSSNSS
jgi:hypothetical protein